MNKKSPLRLLTRIRQNHSLTYHKRFFHPSPRLYQQSVYASPDGSGEDDSNDRKERAPLNFGLVIVPQQKAYVIERLGRFLKILEPGLNFLIPFVDTISYVHSLKEEAVTMTRQHAITRDNVTIEIDGVLYLRIVDPEKASYGVRDPYYAVTQLAQTTMRSELGKMTLDKTFEERENLNSSIVASLNEATDAWGVVCLRYEIRDIKPPQTVRLAMEMQAEAERKKRAQILESEAEQQSNINIAQGMQKARILEAEGEAKSIELKALATAEAITKISGAIGSSNGHHAVVLRVAEQYVEAFGNIAKTGTTMLLPAAADNPASMVAQAMSIYKNVNEHTAKETTKIESGSAMSTEDLFVPADKP